jgi:hypothetical protein
MIYSTEYRVIRDVEGSLLYYPAILEERQRKPIKISRRGAGVPVEIPTGNLQKR